MNLYTKYRLLIWWLAIGAGLEWYCVCQAWLDPVCSFNWRQKLDVVICVQLIDCRDSFLVRARLMIERLWVRILAGVAGEFSSPESTLFADSYFVSVSRWHVKDPGHSAQSAGGRLHLNTYTSWPNEVGVGWLCCCPGIVWEPIRKRTHMQLIWECSVTVVSAHWATVDWSWPKEWN